MNPWHGFLVRLVQKPRFVSGAALTLIFAALAWWSSAWAQTPLRANRVIAPPSIDGDLSDAAWLVAEPFSELTQQFPEEATAPTQKTELRIVYDAHSLFISARCDDHKPGEIIARLTRRDLTNGSDGIAVDLDTRGDGTSAYHFELSAAGVRRDGIRSGDTTIDFDWDGVWRGAARKSASGWSAELEIPFAALRFDQSTTHPFRIQVRRFIGRSNEIDSIVYVPRIEHGEMLRYAPLEGIADIPTPHGLSVTPFALMKLRYRTASVGIDAPRGTDFIPSAGLDARFGLTSGLSLDATVLPDFGQVEADPALLNLSTFETYFPERRPFFLEGSDVFSLKGADGDPTTSQLFYSRRVGRGQTAPVVPGGGALVSQPDVGRVWGAAKLSGRLGDRISIGLFDGFTAREEATVSSADGSLTQEGLSALSNHAAAKVNVAVSSGFQLGAALTDVHRLEPPNSVGLAGQCPGLGYPSASGRCTRDQTTAALDARWRSASGAWAGSAVSMMSLQGDGPALLLRDGATVRAGDLGVGGRFELAKSAGALVLDAVFETYSPKLDLNELGYLPGQNLHRLFLRGGWRLFDVGPFREAIVAGEIGGRQSWDGVPIGRFVQLNASATLANFWTTWLELQWWPSIWDNREAHDGTRVQRAAQFGAEWSIASNPNRAWTVAASGTLHTTWRGLEGDAELSFAVRPIDRLELSVAPTFLRVTGDPRWLETTTDRELQFGLQDALAVGATFRSTFTFTPSMTLQVYAQLFSASVAYEQLYVSRSNAGGWVGLQSLTAVATPPAQFNQQDVVLNMNVVFRWEYRPGSLLYFVFTRTQGATPVDSTATSPRIDFGALRRGTSENFFVVKGSFNYSR